MSPARTPARAAARGAAPKAPRTGSRFSRTFDRLRAAPAGAPSRRAGKIGPFLRDVRSEIKKVEWPSRPELVKLTGAVVGLSALVGVFLGGVDFVFQELFKVIIGLSSGGV